MKWKGGGIATGARSRRRIGCMRAFSATLAARLTRFPHSTVRRAAKGITIWRDAREFFYGLGQPHYVAAVL